MIKPHCDNCDEVITPDIIVTSKGDTRVSRRITTNRGLNVEVWLMVSPAGKDALCWDCHLEVVKKYLAALES